MARHEVHPTLMYRRKLLMTLVENSKTRRKGGLELCFQVIIYC